MKSPKPDGCGATTLAPDIANRKYPRARRRDAPIPVAEKSSAEKRRSSISARTRQEHCPSPIIGLEIKRRKPMMARIEERPKPVDKREHDKSIKTIIGVTVALALGAAVLYEIKRPNTQAASDRPTMSQKAADSTHMPERL
jgi:hypothetical protein